MVPLSAIMVSIPKTLMALLPREKADPVTKLVANTKTGEVTIPGWVYSSKRLFPSLFKRQRVEADPSSPIATKDTLLDNDSLERTDDIKADLNKFLGVEVVAFCTEELSEKPL